MDWTVGAMIYFTGEVSDSSPGWPSCAKEKNRRLTPSCMLHLARGDIAQLVELRSCNWVVAITGWMSNCPGAPFEILRRVALWRAQYDESCKLCSGGVIVYHWPLCLIYAMIYYSWTLIRSFHLAAP
ncbi:hypothetical protein AHAS_Ahas07G0080100 [Arachis hypogaea]